VKTATGQNLLFKSSGRLSAGAVKGKRSPSGGKGNHPSSFVPVLDQKLSSYKNREVIPWINAGAETGKERFSPSIAESGDDLRERSLPDSPVAPPDEARVRLFSPEEKTAVGSFNVSLLKEVSAKEFISSPRADDNVPPEANSSPGKASQGSHSLHGGGKTPAVDKNEQPVQPPQKDAQDTARVRTANGKTILNRSDLTGVPAQGKQASVNRGGGAARRPQQSGAWKKSVADAGSVRLKGGSPRSIVRQRGDSMTMPIKGTVIPPLPADKRSEKLIETSLRVDLPHLSVPKQSATVTSAVEIGLYRPPDPGLHLQIFRLNVIDQAYSESDIDSSASFVFDPEREPSHADGREESLDGKEGRSFGAEVGRASLRRGGSVIEARANFYPARSALIAENPETPKRSPKVENNDTRSKATEKVSSAVSSTPRKERLQQENQVVRDGQKILESLQQRVNIARRMTAKKTVGKSPDPHPIVNLRELVDKIRARAELAKSTRKTVLDARLNPPKLGAVRVQIELTGDQMRLSFSAEHPEAVAALQQARGELTSLVSQYGYNLASCDVENQGADDRWAEKPHPSDAGNRRGSYGESGEEKNDDRKSYSSPHRKMIDYGYNTMELVA
jgi:hypothetical protein